MDYHSSNIKNSFGFHEAQNVSPSYPINTNNILDIYNLTIPSSLPHLTRDDIINNENNKDIIDNGIIDANWINLIYDQLQNLIREIPKYQMPPLFNPVNIVFENKFTKTYVDNIIKRNYEAKERDYPDRQQNQQSSQSQSQQNQQATSSSSS